MPENKLKMPVFGPDEPVPNTGPLVTESEYRLMQIDYFICGLARIKGIGTVEEVILKLCRGLTKTDDTLADKILKEIREDGCAEYDSILSISDEKNPTKRPK